jgi:hypothetical protein
MRDFADALYTAVALTVRLDPELRDIVALSLIAQISRQPRCY